MMSHADVMPVDGEALYSICSYILPLHVPRWSHTKFCRSLNALYKWPLPLWAIPCDKSNMKASLPSYSHHPEWLRRWGLCVFAYMVHAPPSGNVIACMLQASPTFNLAANLLLMTSAKTFVSPTCCGQAFIFSFHLFCRDEAYLPC